MKPLQERWIAINGSIFTERAERKMSEHSGRPIAEPQRDAIAFNVGQQVAEHIVALHNNWYESKGPGWVKRHNEWAERNGTEHWER